MQRKQESYIENGDTLTLTELCKEDKMDKEQLKQLKYLKTEIENIKKQIEEINNTIVADSVKGSSRNFPFIERNFKIEGLEYNNKAKRLERKLIRRTEELLDTVTETNEFIENIEDSLVRQVISLRYINGLTWEEVAANIGGNNTADSMRMLCSRFLEDS